jgi:hypothetical protein
MDSPIGLEDEYKKYMKIKTNEVSIDDVRNFRYGFMLYLRSYINLKPAGISPEEDMVFQEYCDFLRGMIDEIRLVPDEIISPFCNMAKKLSEVERVSLYLTEEENGADKEIILH